MKRTIPLALFALFAVAAAASAGISSMTAHGVTFQPGDVIPVFVDSSTKNSIMVKGQYMDLCVGVESNDGRYTPSIGRRIVGSNSAVEILIGVTAPDQDSATIHIKFASGEETFRVRTFRTKITGFDLIGRPDHNCIVGQLLALEVNGDVANLGLGITGAMLDGADTRYDVLQKLDTSTADSAKFGFKCTAVGTFTINRTWFRDTRVSGLAGDAMARGTATFTVTVKEHF